MKDILAIASLGFSLAANVPYVIETIKGKVKPERISWLLWTMLGFTYYISAIREDGAAFFTFGELIGPGIILALAVKFGVGGKSRFDQYSLLVALLAFVLLFVFDGVLISLVMALIVDGIGALLTIRKLKLDPASESRSFWGMAAIGSVLALLALDTFNTETLLFPVYVLLLSTYIFVLADPSRVKNVKQIEKL